MLEHAGPCYPHMDRREVYRRVRAAAQDLAFEEIGSQGEFVACWRRAHGRWEAMLDRIRRYGFDSKTTGSASRRAPRHTVEDDSWDGAPF